MISNNHFANDLLQRMLPCDQDGDDLKVTTRESSTKEFKESFSFGALPDYARTIAGFANTRGGYLIFGVTDSPRGLTGLNAAAAKKFDNLDRAKLTNGLNELFAPEIQWDSTLVEIQDRPVGLIYVFESVRKPVMALKQNDAIQEGDIFYRYSGRTQRIRYPELNHILEEERSWLLDAKWR